MITAEKNGFVYGDTYFQLDLTTTANGKHAVVKSRESILYDKPCHLRPFHVVNYGHMSNINFIVLQHNTERIYAFTENIWTNSLYIFHSREGDLYVLREYPILNAGGFNLSVDITKQSTFFLGSFTASKYIALNEIIPSLRIKSPTKQQEGCLVHFKKSSLVGLFFIFDQSNDNFMLGDISIFPVKVPFQNESTLALEDVTTLSQDVISFQRCFLDDKLYPVTNRTIKFVVDKVHDSIFVLDKPCMVSLAGVSIEYSVRQGKVKKNENNDIGVGLVFLMVFITGVSVFCATLQ